MFALGLGLSHGRFWNMYRKNMYVYMYRDTHTDIGISVYVRVYA